MITQQDDLTPKLESGFQARFVNFEKLGSGGFGSVYSAYDTAKKVIVALKLLHLDDRPELKERFEQEYAMLRNYPHDRLVPVFDSGKVIIDDERRTVYHWYTMRKFTNSIENVLPAMALLLRSRAVVEIMEALSFIHQIGIAHRDIKPENIFLDRHDHVVVGDFGIAKHTHQPNNLTPTGMVIGDFRYLAPERWGGSKTIDWQKSDQYAAGMTAYFILSGGGHPLTFPESATFGDLALAHVGPRRTLSVPEFARNPHDVNSVLMRMMATDPVKRYDHIKDAMHSLEAALAEESFFEHAS